jgi:DNA invertase Pin-like site-specific DNA recombinase
MTDKQAILVIRVSTSHQDYSPQTLDLKMYAESKGYTKFTIIESKESGLVDIEKREGLEKLFREIESNPNIDAVFATEMSRISRKERILHDIKDFFIKKRIQFYLKDRDFCLLDEKTRKPHKDSILFTLYGYFAESEAATKKDRFARAKRANLENGLSIGGRTLFGFDTFRQDGGKSRLVVNEEQAKQIQKIYFWYLNGIDEVTKSPSIKRISKECIIQGFHGYTHSKRNVNKILKENAYLGFKVTHNKRKNPLAEEGSDHDFYIVTENKIRYPAQLISNEIFEKVQAKLKSNISEADKTQHSTILARLVKCPKCGNHLSANYRTSSNLIRHTYRCTGRAKTIGCDSTLSISMSLLDSAIWSVIKSDYELLKRTISENNPDEALEGINQKIRIAESELRKHEKSFDENQEKMIGAESKRREKLYAHLDNKGDRIRDEISYWEGLIRTYKLEKDALILSDEDKERYLGESIENIEQSKDLLKRFVNLFVSHIEIKHHGIRFSLIAIKFKRTSDLDLKSYVDGEIEPHVYVLLDKRQTLKIRGIKVTKTINLTKDNKIYWFCKVKKRRLQYMSASFESIYTALLTGDHGNLDLSYFKILNFNKLNVYQLAKRLKVSRKAAEKVQL